ncbi:hypothetical protein D3C87_1871910 [compost metagenome]
MMVMTNSHTHQRGSGLFISTRSSSQTWPVVLSALAITFLRPANQSRMPQAMMPPRVSVVTKTDQKLLVKSLMGCSHSCEDQSVSKGSCAASSNRALLRPR